MSIINVPTCYYEQFDADYNLEVPAEGYGGWEKILLPLNLEKTALVVMHAWDCGIVGRQSGYVNGCTNNGIIYGRKDVGGIAGQIEPYAFWELSENSLGKLRKELNTLQSLINTAINNTDQYSSAISTQLTTVGRHIEDVKTAGDVLVDQTISLLNDSIDNINDVSARIAQVLVAMEPIMGSFSAAIGDMKMAIGKFKTAMEQMKIMAKGIEFGIYKLNPAFGKIDAALDAIKGQPLLFP
jgi:hypothetical protein